nr:hypothetical protein GCM10020092_002420 [Actinoplanes digitatis]
MRVKTLAEPVAVEPPRSGEDAGDCVACNTPDDAYIWVSERWRVRGMDRPTGLPMVLILECRSHLDIGDLPNLLAAELGVMTVRLERAIRTLDGVARVHVNRWGDGSAHLHMWFLARPYGQLQLRGTFLSLWDDILPVIPEEQWLENLALVAAWLADFGGRAIAEPPHIHWQSPSTFSNEPTAEADTTVAADAWHDGGTADPESNLPRAGSTSGVLGAGDPESGGSPSDDAAVDGAATGESGIGGPSRGGVTDVDAETRNLSAYTVTAAATAAPAAPADPTAPADQSSPVNADSADTGSGEAVSADAGTGRGNDPSEVPAAIGSGDAESPKPGVVDASSDTAGELAVSDSDESESDGDGSPDPRAVAAAVGGATEAGAAPDAVRASAIPLQYRPSGPAAHNERDGDDREAGGEEPRPQADQGAATVVPEAR